MTSLEFISKRLVLRETEPDVVELLISDIPPKNTTKKQQETKTEATETEGEQTQEPETQAEEADAPQLELEHICFISPSKLAHLHNPTSFISIPGVAARIELTLPSSDQMTLTISPASAPGRPDANSTSARGIHLEALMGCMDLEPTEVLIISGKRIAPQKPGKMNMMFPLMMILSSYMQRKMVGKMQNQMHPQLTPEQAAAQAAAHEQSQRSGSQTPRVVELPDEEPAAANQEKKKKKKKVVKKVAAAEPVPEEKKVD